MGQDGGDLGRGFQGRGGFIKGFFFGFFFLSRKRDPKRLFCYLTSTFHTYDTLYVLSNYLVTGYRTLHVACLAA